MFAIASLHACEHGWYTDVIVRKAIGSQPRYAHRAHTKTAKRWRCVKYRQELAREGIMGARPPCVHAHRHRVQHAWRGMCQAHSRALCSCSLRAAGSRGRRCASRCKTPNAPDLMRDATACVPIAAGRSHNVLLCSSHILSSSDGTCHFKSPHKMISAKRTQRTRKVLVYTVTPRTLAGS